MYIYSQKRIHRNIFKHTEVNKNLKFPTHIKKISIHTDIPIYAHVNIEYILKQSDIDTEK